MLSELYHPVPLQYHRDMNKELIAAQTLYASAQRHLVATTPGQGLGVLTRAWCCFELAIRMKVRPRMVSLYLAFSKTQGSLSATGDLLACLRKVEVQSALCVAPFTLSM